MKTQVKVAEYRNMIDAVHQAFRSLRSTPCPKERAREAQWVRDTASRLMNAECKRASADDIRRAEAAIDVTAAYLIEHNLTAGAAS